MSRRSYNKRLAAGCGLGLMLLFLSLVPSVGLSQVTRDDFILCDTSADSIGSAVWPSVALDELGQLSLLYLRQQVTESEATLRLSFVSFDASGVIKGSEVVVLPDTLAGDSVRWPTGPTPLSGNDSGRLFFPVHATYNDLDNVTVARGVDYFTSDAEKLRPEPIRAALIPMDGNHYRPHMAVGDINNRGLCASAWVARQAEAPYGAKLFVRLYDAAAGELRKFLVPSSLPPPLDRAGIALERQPKGPPAIAVNDSGGFAAVWIGKAGGDARVLFAVYDKTGRPRGPVRFADSEETARVAVRTVNVAGEADGDFYLVWSGDRLGFPEHYCRTHLWMRGFDVNGLPKFDAIRVDDADSTNIVDVGVVYPSIACDDSGNVLIAWSDARLHSNSHRSELRQDVFVQRFAPDGRRVGGNARVNNACGLAGLRGTDTDCDLNNKGQAIIVWREFGRANTIKAQLVPLSDIGRTIPGDLNCDMVVDRDDLTVLREYLLGRQPNTFWPRSQADCNGDGRVDISDLVYLSGLTRNTMLGSEVRGE